VLDGALALALPLRFGQEMEVSKGLAKATFTWKSYNAEGNCWFEGSFSAKDGTAVQTTDPTAGEWLQKLFFAIEAARPGFLASQSIDTISTRLDFPNEWGFGSSSTLVAALGKWSGVDPFVLLGQSFGGSGYDIACATAASPILFQRLEGKPQWVQLPYQPTFAHQLYFVYLGKKQNSREGIQRYRALGSARQHTLQEVSKLTLQFLQATTLTTVQQVMAAHEEMVSQVIELPKVKDLLFADFPGSIKSLGAWGGDFVMAASELPAPEVRQYFKEQGCAVCLGWEEVRGSG